MADRNHDTASHTFVDERTDGPGVTRLDPADPAAPMYRLLSKIRAPVTLRDTMILPVRRGYAGQTPPDGAAAALPRWDHRFPDVGVQELVVPSHDGPIRCQVYAGKRSSVPSPLLLYIHGGGFMVGRSEDTDYMTRRICADNGVVVISVNYRLAPEWPFPAGLEDCLAVYAWLRANGGTLGGDPARVAAAGDSSGGNLAAALPLCAAARGLVQPDAVALFAPVLDMRFEAHESFNRLAPLGVVFDAAFMGFLRGAYCRYAEWDHPHVSPARADLNAYPPAMIAVGSHDPLVDSCVAFANRLRAATGREATLYVADGMPHGFYFWPSLFREEDEAYARLRGFFANNLRTAA